MKLTTRFLGTHKILSPDIAYFMKFTTLGLGVFLLASAVYEFARAKTNIEAFREPNSLITSGIFGFTRNPIYLGFQLVLISYALHLNAWSALVLTPLFFLLADRWYIPHEERDALRLFGQDYLDYKARVRRWL